MSGTENTRRVAIAGGDGIGPEVTAEGRRALAWFAQNRALPVSLVDVDYGAAAYRGSGEVLPAATLSAMRDAHATLFGATGGPEFDAIPRRARHAGSLLVIRRSFELYANLRPVRILPALYEASPLKARVLDGVNMLIVRELTGGIYFGEPRTIETLPSGERRGHKHSCLYVLRNPASRPDGLRTGPRSQRAGLFRCERECHGGRCSLA